MARKKISNVHKATAAGGIAAAVSAYAAAWISSRYTVPLEVSSVVVGGIIGYVSRLIAKMLPDA